MWIKVCGVASVAAAKAIRELGMDAVGLNFYRQSRRYVTPETARQIVSLLPESITPVGVFVNAPLDEVRSICQLCGLRTIQLHGDESPEFAGRLSEYDIIRAFRVGQDGLPCLASALREYAEQGIELRGCLIDAAVPGEYGGTGRLAPWDMIARDWESAWPPLILAGGLTPANVVEAIRTVRPYGVDVASGVQSSPGQPDPAAVREFISQARAAGASHVPL